jgi:hypothetical protein
MVPDMVDCDEAKDLGKWSTDSLRHLEDHRHNLIPPKRHRTPSALMG